MAGSSPASAASSLPAQPDQLNAAHQQMVDDASFHHMAALVSLHRDGIAAASAPSVLPAKTGRDGSRVLVATAAGAAVAGAATAAVTQKRGLLPKRRTVLAGAGATVAAAALLAPESVGAATLKAAATSNATPAQATVQQAIMRRVSYGLTPQLESDVSAARGWLKWIDAQIAGVSDSPGTVVDSWFPTLNWTASQCGNWYAQKVGSGDQTQVIEAHATLGYYRGSRFLARAVHSKRQLAERMVDFWFNHFNVPSTTSGLIFETEYDAVVRANAMGSFANLLSAVTTSGLMLNYLNANVSSQWTLNENLGRELLELHTVGVGNYTEAHVRDSARMLTGWTVLWSPYFTTTYNPTWHSTGPVTVMDFTHPNADPDGRAALQGYLTYLAHHPATAKRLAYQLIQYFCADSPDPVHVANVANAYLSSNTDIKATLNALFHDPKFAVSGLRIANPMEDFVAGWRLRGNTPTTPTWRYAYPDSYDTLSTRYPHVLLSLSNLAGRQPLTWPTPDGFPLDSHRYENAGTLLTEFNTHQWLAAGTWHPGFTPTAWQTLIGFTAPMSAASVVDKVARYLWRQPADDNLRAAARVLWSLSDLSTTIAPNDGRGTCTWMIASVALNHPLMLTR